MPDFLSIFGIKALSSKLPKPLNHRPALELETPSWTSPLLAELLKESVPKTETREEAIDPCEASGCHLGALIIRIGFL